MLKFNEMKTDYMPQDKITQEMFNEIGDNLNKTKEEVNKKVTLAGEFMPNVTYEANSIITKNKEIMITNEEFTAGETIDYSKVTILVPKGEYDHFTMEIDGNNSANPSIENGYIKYSGGCEKFTKQDWIEWIGYKPCIMQRQGFVECYLNPDNYKKDINGNTVDISTISETPRNVMVEFSRIGLMSKKIKPGKWIIHLTNDPCDMRYSYAAFQLGKRQNTKIFIGAYNATIDSDKLHSLSNADISVKGQSLSSYRKLANAVGVNYQLLDSRKLAFLQHMYIVQNATIDGKIASSWNGNNTITGTQDESGLNMEDTSGCYAKYLGIETNCFSEVVDGIYVDSNYRLKIATSNNFNDTAENYDDCGRIYTIGSGFMGKDTSFSPDCGFLANNKNGTATSLFKASTKTVKQETFMSYNPRNIFDYEFTQGATKELTGFTARLCFILV